MGQLALNNPDVCNDVLPSIKFLLTFHSFIMDVSEFRDFLHRADPTLCRNCDVTSFCVRTNWRNGFIFLAWVWLNFWWAGNYSWKKTKKGTVSTTSVFRIKWFKIPGSFLTNNPILISCTTLHLLSSRYVNNGHCFSECLQRNAQNIHLFSSY